MAGNEDSFIDSELRRHRKIFAPSQQVILEKLRTIKDWELRGLSCFQYLSAARISESLAFKQGDMSIISFERRRYAKFRLKTLKNKKTPFRMLNSPLFHPIELEIFEYFRQLYERRMGLIFPNQHSRNNVWKKYNHAVSFDCQVFNLKTKEFAQEEVKLFPHLLRHFRLSHLVEIYHFNPFQLQEFAGWSSIAPAQYYIALSPESMMRQFVTKK